jgi:hypothetical protein
LDAARDPPPAGDLGDGANTTARVFAVFADDFNRDGWTDVLVIGFPGQPCHWYENPKNRTGGAGHWKERLVANSACNETPVFADLFGDRTPRLVMGTQPSGQMCWFEPDATDMDAPWIAHPISAAKSPGTQPFSHGLGVGDVNGDGRNDVLVREGWWEQPWNARNTAAPWKFHAADLGEDCADMFALDLNGDKRPDVVSSSAHRKGLWWHEQPAGANGSWTRHLVTDAFSQTHSLRLVDINRDGRRDLVTGKRWWAHGPTGEVDPNAPPVLVWIDAVPGRNGSSAPAFTIYPIDDASGVGTQFAVEDVNGDRRPDIVVANKRGVFLFEQQPPAGRRANNR